jgi:hypothetical protein
LIEPIPARLPGWYDLEPGARMDGVLLAPVGVHHVDRSLGHLSCAVAFFCGPVHDPSSGDETT